MTPALKTIGQTFIELQTVDSTNNYATALLHEGMAQHGTVVFAHHQTAGRGQRSKSWFTGAANNLAMSVVVQPSGLPLSQMFLLSMATAVGVWRFFSRHAGLQTKVKWPNDLYWNDRKAGGILIENSISGTEWKYAIVGIGININEPYFVGFEDKAVSLQQITGKQYNVVTMAKSLCQYLEEAFTILNTNKGALIAEYGQQLYKKNSVVRLKKGSRVFETFIKGVNTEGQLITGQVVEELFSVGEVEWLI